MRRTRCRRGPSAKYHRVARDPVRPDHHDVAQVDSTAVRGLRATDCEYASSAAARPPYGGDMTTVPLAGKPTSYWVDSTPETTHPQLDRDLTVDVAIVGGGMLGITAALMLKRAGA